MYNCQDCDEYFEKPNLGKRCPSCGQGNYKSIALKNIPKPIRDKLKKKESKMNREEIIKQAILEVLSFVYTCPECGKSSELKNPEESLACPSCGFDVAKNTSFIDLPTDNLKIKVRPDDKRESSIELEKIIAKAVKESLAEENSSAEISSVIESVAFNFREVLDFKENEVLPQAIKDAIANLEQVISDYADEYDLTI